MGKIYDHIDANLKTWIEEQKVFFVATAPLSAEGHVNCSPKNGDSFRVLDEHTVAYLDLTGSGVETIAHVEENARIVVMFCALTGAPKIVRLHGLARVYFPKDPEFAGLVQSFDPAPGIRSIILVQLSRISDSCGYGVPLYDFRGPRTQLRAWAEHKGAGGIAKYQTQHNSQSIDRLPGIQ